MRRVATIDAFRGIQKRFVSFLSIVLIVMLGTAGFFITQYLKLGMQETAIDYYADYNFKDMQMISSLGITDDDVEEIRNTPGVEDAEGVVLLNGKYTYKGDSNNIVIISESERISMIELVEGRNASAANECTVGADMAKHFGMEIGDRIDLSASFNNSEVLLNKTFTIVGLHNHPDYIRTNGTYAIVLSKKAYDQDVLNNLYTRVFITTEKDKRYSIFSNEYFEDQAQLKNRLEVLARDLELSSIKYMQKLGNDMIDEKWAEAKKELDNAQSQIDEGTETLNRELSSARYQINVGQNTLNESYDKLIDAQIQIEAGQNELVAAMASYNTIKSLLDATGISQSTMRNKLNELRDNAQAAIDALETGDRTVITEKLLNLRVKILEINRDYIGILTVIDYYTGLNTQNIFNALDAIVAVIQKLTADDVISEEQKAEAKNTVQSIYDAANKALNGLNKFDNAAKQIEDAKERLNDAKQELADGWKQYEAGKSRLSSAQAQMNSEKAKAEEQIADAKTLLDEKTKEAEVAIQNARDQLEDIQCTWVVTDRHAEAGYVELVNNIGAFANAGTVFGILFAFVGGLVCFSTLIIIIEEERKYVGTAKAFGLKNNEVLGKYLLFGVLSVTLGCILGVLVAYFATDVIQLAIANTGMFNFGRAKTVINVPITLMVCAGIIIMAATVTVLSCTGLLRSPASALMKGQVITKKKKKKESRNANRGTLYSRLIVRNVLNDKARVIISIIIVAGSVLIVGSGITIKEGFVQMQQRQIKDIFRYDVRIDFNGELSDEKLTQIERVLNRKNVFYTYASYYGNYFRNGDNLDGVNLIVANAKEINNFINIKDPVTGKAMELPEKGFLAQNKLTEVLNLKEGDTWVLYDGSLNKHYISYSDDFLNYVGRVIMMSNEAYEKAFNKEAVPNCIYVNLDGADYDALTSELLMIDENLSFDQPSAMITKFKPVTALYDIIVYVMIGISILMSFMILTNLANIFINRKKKELIVMRINGFSVSRTKNYLARETIATTIMGLVLGAGIGIAVFAKMVLKTMEGKNTQFVRDVNIKAWLIAVSLEAIFALVIYILAFKKVEKLNFREVS